MAPLKFFPGSSLGTDKIPLPITSLLLRTAATAADATNPVHRSARSQFARPPLPAPPGGGPIDVESAPQKWGPLWWGIKAREAGLNFVTCS
jgi:hypothetical protein